MKTKYFILLFTLAIFSCSQEVDLNVDFDDSITIDELLDSDKYYQLKIDDDYNNYIHEVWENVWNLNSHHITGAELMASGKLIEDTNDFGEVKSGFSYFYNGLKSAASMALDGYDMANLEKEKKNLYSTFSEDKKELAQDFEEKIVNIIKKSAEIPINPNVKEGDTLQNFKSFKSVIKRDKNLYKNLDALTDKVEEFFSLGYKLRTALYLNKEIKDRTDYSQLSSYGFEIINSKGLYDVSTSSSLLNKYYKSLNQIIYSLNNIHFDVPVESWSEEKKENYYFIIDDINIKIRNEIRNIERVSAEAQSTHSEILSPQAFLERINEKFKLKDFNEALKETNNGLKLHPQNGDLYTMRGSIRMAVEDNAGALEDFELAKELSPHNYETYLLSGCSKMILEDYAGAIHDFNMYLDSDPSDIGDRINSYDFRGLCKLKLGQYQEAIHDFNMVIEMQGDENISNTLVLRARSKYHIEDHEGAIEDYDIVIEKAPNNSVAHIERARSKDSLQDYRGAINDYTIAIKLTPDDSDLYIKRARLNEITQNYEETINDYTKVIEINPDEPDYYNKRASAKKRLEDYVGAINDYSKAIELTPEKDDYYLYRAGVKLSMEDYQGAINDFTRTIELTSDEILLPGLYANRAAGKIYMEDYLGAIEDCNKSLRLDEEYAAAYHFRGIAKIMTEEIDGGCYDLLKAKEIGRIFSEESFKVHCENL